MNRAEPGALIHQSLQSSRLRARAGVWKGKVMVNNCGLREMLSAIHDHTAFRQPSLATLRSVGHVLRPGPARADVPVLDPALSRALLPTAAPLAPAGITPHRP
ncbi:unnamed protein product [Victoria cruziana]